MRMLEARSGEWRRWKLPPEPEPEPIPPPAAPKPDTVIVLSHEEMVEISRRRIRVERGESPDGPTAETLAARARLVVPVSSPR
jgi:hypothetical protein